MQLPLKQLRQDGASNGQAVVWNSTLGQWVPATLMGSAPKQESVTTQAITGTDTALTDTLNNTPVSNASVRLSLNGVLQEQGTGKDYTISGSTITWLASTGTAVDMDTSDVLIAVYDSP